MFNEDKFKAHVNNFEHLNDDVCDFKMFSIEVKNVPCKKSHEGEEVNLKNLNIVYTYIMNNPEVTEIDFNEIS